MANIPAIPPDEEVPVKLPSGAVFYVHPLEVNYVKDRSTRYMKDNALTNVSDLQDLDRVLMLELLCFRWTNWITRQRDYWDDAVDPNLLQKALKDHSSECRLLKRGLGMDKPTRTKESGIDSPIVFLEKLKERAGYFGINRDNMSAKAIEIMMEVIANATLWHNTTKEERMDLHVGRNKYPCTGDGIVEWLYEEVKPDFEEVDKHFRETNQKMWVEEM